MYVKLDFNKYKENVLIENKYDKENNCNYIFTKIKKIINENEKIHPRIRLTNIEYSKSTSLHDFMINDEILFGINGGIFNTSKINPECILVLNGKEIIDMDETYIHTSPLEGGNKRNELYILGIDIDGDFKIYDSSYTAKDIINDGCIDAFMGFVPIILDYKEFKDALKICSYSSYDKHPRQIIGQFRNDDYFIITVDSPGMDFTDLYRILKEYDIKVAYNLDGGSSTQTIFHKTQLNPIYREDTGRRIPTIITFEVIIGDLIY
jgi:exopolysaccharide biosynthesis protein